MESLLRCPLCAQPLDRQDTRYLCPRGHSFDRAAAGYVHLLPANKLHSKDPGDDKAMAAARNRFLSGGYYDPFPGPAPGGKTPQDGWGGPLQARPAPGG